MTYVPRGRGVLAAVCMRRSIFLTRLVKGSLVSRTNTRATRSLELQTGQRFWPAHGPVTHLGMNPERLLRAPTGGPERSGSSAFAAAARIRTAATAPERIRGDMGEVPFF